MIKLNKSGNTESILYNKSQTSRSNNLNNDNDDISIFETEPNDGINQNGNILHSEATFEDNDFPVNIKDKSLILNTKYNEYGDFCIEYKDNTKEIYTKDNNGKFVLYTKSRKIQNGEIIQYYDTEGKKVIGEETYNKKIDNQNNQVILTYDYKSQQTKDRSISKYIYNTNEENYKNLSKIEISQNYNGKKYESEYIINRDSELNMISLERKYREANGAVYYSKFEGERGEAALNSILNGENYNGFPNENTKYDKNGNIREKRIYELGETGALESISQYDKQNNIIAKQSNFDLDNNYTAAYQGGIGDCYFLAAINSFSQSNTGQEILRNNISKSTDENGQTFYTVRFPGAEKALESLKNNLDEDNIYIKGAYTVLQSEIDEAAANINAYSIGDRDILLYEIAFDKYRHDVKKTVEANNINPYETNNYSGLEGYINPDIPIDGGFGSEVKFLLTGLKPDVWYKKDYQTDRVGVLLDSTNHSAVIKNDINIENPMPEPPKKDYISLEGFMQTANISFDEYKKEELISRLINDAKDGTINDNAATIGINVAYPGEKSFCPHEVSIVNITDSDVTIIDSNDKTLGIERKYKMSMENFKHCITSLDVLKLK